MSGCDPIAVVGAGPAGSLIAIYLARQGHDVTVFERRSDLRRYDVEAGRSINLALATRGIVPLVEVGVIDRIDAITIPMRGRMVHAVGDPTPALQPYGSRDHEVIHSVSRSDLNAILLDAAEETGRVTLEFDRPLEAVDVDPSEVEGCELRFADGTTASFGAVIGADGAGSLVREALVQHGVCDARTEWLDHSYKELTLPPTVDGRHLIDPHALHIWPRGEFMLIALANPGGDFTVTLFAPTNTFDSLDSADSITAFFSEHFTDFAELVPDLVEQYLDHPTGPLGTLRAAGWSLGGRAVLLGDAAHAIVPFHGQGMNAAMESARVLAQQLEAHPDDRAAAFAAYESQRKPDGDAIAEMALGNYLEMRAGVIDDDYLARRKLALELERRHPAHLSPRYNMVMFSTMPYVDAKQRAERQAELIGRALEDPTLDVDALVAELPPLPALDPLADPKALSV